MNLYIGDVKFNQLIAKYVSGNLSISQLPEIAFIGIEEGLQSESLIILAGLQKDENSFVINQYFNSSLNELAIVLPDKRNAAIEYAIGIAEDILSDKKELISGLSEIYQKAIMSYDFYSETKNYLFDSIFFERAYGCYVEYDDAESEFTPGNQNQENELAEMKKELRKELIIWLNKILSVK